MPEGTLWWVSDLGNPDASLPITLTWDYSDAKAQIEAELQVDPNNFYYCTLIIAAKNYNYSSGGVYYFDNIQLYASTPARDPNPPDGATDVQIEPTLSWKPGMRADTHNVYLGTDFNDVNDVNTANLASYLNVTYSNVDVNSYKPRTLEFNTTYYWRVDEINGPDIWKGAVWSFTTGEYLIVDDIESYGDANTPGPPTPPGSRIWYTWRDGYGWTIPSPGYAGNGTGSIVDVNNTIVRTVGVQSLKINYSNIGFFRNAYQKASQPYYSEVEREFVPAQNWSAEDMTSLTLWFYGDPANNANATEQMYVKLNGVKINYDGNMNDIREAKWHEWNIDLAAFGVDLTNVTSFAIGFGDEANTTEGGWGAVYFDDIRLYPSRCFPLRRKPVGDFDNDCQVSYTDLDIMASDWLDADYTADPLIAWYKFNDGSGTTAVDSSVNGNNGTLVGNPQWVAGQIGGALQFDGDDYVDMGNNLLFNPSDSFSITLWAYITDWSQEWSHVMISRRGELGIGWQLRRNGAYWGLGAVDGICFTTGGVGNADTGVPDTPTNTAPPLNEWIHIAAVYDNVNNTKSIYLNSVQQVVYNTNPGAITLSTHNVYIGARANMDNTGPEAFFSGMLDDVRLYDKALLQAEIASIRDGTLGTVSNYHPVQSSADLYQAELPGSRAVNFRDFAVLADMWLEKQLWP
jgi:hypothetical protein